MPNISNIPIGVVDTDRKPVRVDKGNLIESYDTFSGHGSNAEGARVPMPGTLQPPSAVVSFSGNASAIGVQENKQRANLIYFIKNDTEDHGIYVYDPSTQQVSRLSPKGEFLNFNNDIDSIVIVDGKYAFWTDGMSMEDDITGNPPRMIDIDRANDDGKNLQYEVIFGGGFVNNTRYRVDFYEMDGTPIISSEITVSGVAGDKKAGLAVIEAWLNGIVSPSVNVENNGCSLIVTVGTVEVRMRITSSYSGIPAENAWDVLTIPRNHYVFEDIFPIPNPDRILTDKDREFMISRVKYQPSFAPTYEFGTDAAYTSNHINRITPQFTFRYVFWDRSKSAWGPYSNVLIPDEDHNIATISFTDTLLTSSATLGLITHIELAVRYSNTGLFRMIDSIPICELVVQPDVGGAPLPFEYTWYNDAVYPLVPSDEDGDPETQVLKVFDSAPRISGAVCSVTDENGKTILIDSALKEKFNLPVVDADIAVYTLGSYTDAVYKRNSRWKMSIIYADDAGRRTVSIPLGVFETGGWDDYNYTDQLHPEITINSLAPAWATKFFIARTKNLTYQRWKPLFSIPDNHLIGPTPVNQIDHIEFGKVGSNEQGFTALGYGDPDATHMRVAVLSPFLNTDLTDDAIVNFETNDAEWFFQPSVGDRFRMCIRTDSAGSVLELLDDDYEIVGYEYEVKEDYYPVSEPEYKIYYIWLYAKIKASTPDYSLQLDNGWMVELYTPKDVEEEIYYEVYGGEIIYSSELGAGFHQGNGQNQTPFLPAIVRLFGTGDAYLRGNSIPDYPRIPLMTTMDVEVENAFLFIDSKVESLGKPSVEDDTYGEEFYRSRHRASDLYVPETSINGLSSFRALNYIHTNQDFGSVKRTAMVQNVLLAVHEFKVQPIYVSKDRMLSLDGSNVGRTSKLLNIADELIQDWGIQTSSSFITEDGRAYGWDGYRGVWWVYSTQGLEDAGKQRSDFFRNVSGDAIFGFDRKRQIVFMTVSRNTYGFSVLKNGQEGNYSFEPERYGRVGTKMFMFKNGQIWHHAENSDMANYFGVQYTPTMTIPLSKDNAVRWDQIKVFRNLRVMCPQQKLILPNNDSIIIPPTVPYGSGMASRLKANKFNNYEGQWHADLLRDINDPLYGVEVEALLRGRLLRGEVILLKFEPETPEDHFEFFLVDVGYNLS